MFCLVVHSKSYLSARVESKQQGGVNMIQHKVGRLLLPAHQKQHQRMKNLENEHEDENTVKNKENEEKEEETNKENERM